MGEKGLKWLEQLWQCFLSIVKILLQSKWRTRLPSSFSNPDELLILANGPSLNRTVEDSTDFIKGKTLLAVNFCVSSPMFERLRPELYLIADPLFWIVPEKRIQLFKTMAEKATWDMDFFVPARRIKNGNPYWRVTPTSSSMFIIQRLSKASRVSATGYSAKAGAFPVRITC